MIELIEDFRDRIAAAKREELPVLLGRLRELEGLALLRLNTPPPAPPAISLAKQPDELLDVEQAAARLCVSKAWLYSNWKSLPFARKMEWGLRFSARGIEEYLQRAGRE